MLLALALILSAQMPVPTPLADARASYDNEAFVDAIAILDGALAGDLPNEERARFEAFAGVVRARMGDDAAARAAFERAVALDACVPFPDAPAPEPVHALFDDVKRAHGSRRADDLAWPVPAGLAFAAAGGVALAAAGIVGAIAFSSNAEANAALVQSDALALDAVSREQAGVANSLAIVGAILVVGGAATAGLGLVVE